MTVLDEMHQIPATDVKRSGWRAIDDALDDGPVLVTTYGRPAGVVLSPAEYERLVTLADKASEDTLQRLRREWDERLASLKDPDVGDRMRAAMGEVHLGGRGRAGSY